MPRRQAKHAITVLVVEGFLQKAGHLENRRMNNVLNSIKPNGEQIVHKVTLKIDRADILVLAVFL